MSIVEEIQAGLTERKGKKVNVRRLKVGDTISLPVFPDGKRKMINFKVTGVEPHAAGGFTVKASSVKPGLADTSRTFSVTDHVTLIEEIEEETLVEELKAESAMSAERVEEISGNDRSKKKLLGQIRDMDANLLWARNVGLPAKVEGVPVASMAELKAVRKHIEETRILLKTIRSRVRKLA